MSIISVVCFAFVDNTDLSMSTLTLDAIGEESKPLFQVEHNCWSELLTVRGGELEQNLGDTL